MEEWGAVYDFVLSRQGLGSQCFGRASFRPIAKAYGIPDAYRLIVRGGGKIPSICRQVSSLRGKVQ